MHSNVAKCNLRIYYSLDIILFSYISSINAHYIMSLWTTYKTYIFYTFNSKYKAYQYTYVFSKILILVSFINIVKVFHLIRLISQGRGPRYLWSTRGIQFSLAKNSLCPTLRWACTGRSSFPRPCRTAISGRCPSCRSPFGKLKSVQRKLWTKRRWWII